MELLFRRGGVLAGLAQTIATQQEDLGVLHQAVGDGRGNGGVKEDVAPVGKWCVRSDDRGTLLTVPRGDDLIKKIGSLLIEREIAKLVNKCSAEHLLTNVKFPEMWS
jgi:hypothetical protein